MKDIVGVSWLSESLRCDNVRNNKMFNVKVNVDIDILEFDEFDYEDYSVKELNDIIKRELNV